MPKVFIPPALQTLTAGNAMVVVAGQSVNEALDVLEARYPQLQGKLRTAEGLRPGLRIVVGHRAAPLGLRTPVQPEDEIHFLPALGGG